MIHMEGISMTQRKIERAIEQLSASGLNMTAAMLRDILQRSKPETR
jgi:hypothetical protein